MYGTGTPSPKIKEFQTWGKGKREKQTQR